MISIRNLLSCIVATHFSVVLAIIVCAPSISHAQSDSSPQENIHIATLEGDYQLIKRLLDEGVSPDEYNTTGFAPLHSAARSNRSDIVNLLLDYGADVNIQSRTRIDPEQGSLHIAARNGYLALINLLLSRGADPNLQDSLGNTPLHDAAISGVQSITRALIRSGARMDVRNEAGEDVLEVAAENLGRDAFSRNLIFIPITTGIYMAFDILASPDSNAFGSVLQLIDIGIGFSMLFPIGDTIFFMGPEAGMSVAIFPLFLPGDLLLRVPIHAVFHIAFRHNLTFDVVVGTALSALIGDQTLPGGTGGMAFDVGGRVEMGNNFLVGLQYTLPVLIPFDEPQPGASENSRNNRRYIHDTWQNSLKISLGYRVRL